MLPRLVLDSSRRFSSRGSVWSGGVSFDLGGAENQLDQTLQRIGAVGFLRAVLLSLDNQHAIAGDAAVTQCQQPLLVELGQGRGRNVEAQVHSAGDLVDICPPAPCARMAVSSISASGRCTLLEITSMEKRPYSEAAGYAINPVGAAEGAIKTRRIGRVCRFCLSAYLEALAACSACCAPRLFLIT